MTHITRPITLTHDQWLRLLNAVSCYATAEEEVGTLASQDLARRTWGVWDELVKQAPVVARVRE
jgi:hypothetical protein